MAASKVDSMACNSVDYLGASMVALMVVLRACQMVEQTAALKVVVMVGLKAQHWAERMVETMAEMMDKNLVGCWE